MSKLHLLVGLGVGYVLGSKAGREQYRKIAAAAKSTWEKPAVQRVAQRVDAFVDEKAPALHSVAETALSPSQGSGEQSGNENPSSDENSSGNENSSNENSSGNGNSSNENSSGNENSSNDENSETRDNPPGQQS